MGAEVYGPTRGRAEGLDRIDRTEITIPLTPRSYLESPQWG
jgi:hypothetical protein